MQLAALRQLPLTTRDKTYRYFAIDPGSDTLGLAVMDYYIPDRTLTVIDLTTLHASKQIKDHPMLVEYHGEKFARLWVIGQILTHYIDHYQPDGFISESPFLGKFAASFRALVECMLVIEQRVIAYTAHIPLETVDPVRAKQAVGIKAKGSTKEDVANAVIAELRIQFAEGIARLGRTEHEYDACAVGFYKFKTLIGELQCI